MYRLDGMLLFFFQIAKEMMKLCIVAASERGLNEASGLVKFAGIYIGLR